MRVQPLITPVLSVVLAVAVGQTATAQFVSDSHGGEAGGFSGPPVEGGPAPGGYAPPPPAGGMPAANYQPNMTAWPKISPFDNRFSEHYVDDGLWHHEVNNAPRHYFLNVDAFFAEYRKPGREMIGNPDAAGSLLPPPNRDIRYQPGTTGALYGDYIGAPLLFQGGRLALDTNVIRERSGDSDPEEVGVKVKWGFTEPDNTGFELEGFWVPETDYFFQRGSREGGTAFFITAGLPLFVGGQNVLAPVATMVEFNRFYRIEYDQQSAGGNMNWRFTNLLDTNVLDLQPTVGLRYLFVREHFGFEGIRNPSGIDFLGNRGGPRLAVPPFFLTEPDVTSTLESDVETHLAGPQVGLKYTVGDPGGFRILGQTDFGLLVNYEQLQIRGQGIGDPNQPDFNPALQFHKEVDHTRVSPMLSTAINAELPIFHYIPVLRNWHVLDKARLNVGYSITAVFELSRPHEIIGWYGQPFTPIIREDDRSAWYVQGGNLGVRWDW